MLWWMLWGNILIANDQILLVPFGKAPGNRSSTDGVIRTIFPPDPQDAIGATEVVVDHAWCQKSTASQKRSSQRLCISAIRAWTPGNQGGGWWMMVDVGKVHIIGAIEWGVVHMNEGWNYLIKSYQIHMSWTSPCCGSWSIAIFWVDSGDPGHQQILRNLGCTVP